MESTAFTPVLTKFIHEGGSSTLDHYLARDGYRIAKEIVGTDPAAVLKTVMDSGLRGRGGAGFPTGKKWSFLAKDTGKPIYLAVNGDESEPGTFKDRHLIEKDPHLLLEGMILASYAIGSHHAFLYMRGEFTDGYDIMRRAVQEAEKKGFIGRNIFGKSYDLKITLVRGAGAYICGEETGMLTSIEGNRGYPKLKPPFPAISGLFGSPTIINNVETICNVPHILRNGTQWFKQWGTDQSPGFKIFCVSGHVNKPGVYELPLGTPLREVIDVHAGGVRAGKKIKAVIPGGSSTPLLTGPKIEQARMDYESLATLGTFLGSGGITVLDEDTDMVRAIFNLMKFYHHESCGQCTPCREGTGWLEKIVHRIHKNHGSMQDLNLIADVCNNMRGRTICPLADAAVMPMLSYLNEFRKEFEARVSAGNN